VAIAFECAAPVELGQSPEALGLERLAGRMQLDQVGLDPSVGHAPNVSVSSSSIADRSSLTGHHPGISHRTSTTSPRRTCARRYAVPRARTVTPSPSWTGPPGTFVGHV
jgi:hypothetical protein